MYLLSHHWCRDSAETMSNKLTNFFARRGKAGTTDEELLEISLPTNFQHTSHIGWTDDATFELRNIPPEWKRFFQAAGIRKRDLEDPETRKAIFAVLFNQDNGDGTDAGTSEAEYDDMPGLGPVIYQQPVYETDETEPAPEENYEEGEAPVEEEEVPVEEEEAPVEEEEVPVEAEEAPVEEEEEEDVPPLTPPRNLPYPVPVNHEHNRPSYEAPTYEENEGENEYEEGEDDGHGYPEYHGEDEL